MKKGKKLVIIIGIILILIILAMIGFYLSIKMKIYTFTIAKIDGNNITAMTENPTSKVFQINEIKVKDENGNDINIYSLQKDDEIYVYDEENGINYFCTVQEITNNDITVQMPDVSYYSFTIKNPVIKNINGKNINASDLKVGDTIRVIDWIPEITYDLAYFTEGHSVEHLSDVKRIKVVKQDIKDVQAIENRDKIATKEAVVVKVNDDSIDVMGTDNEDDLLTVKYSEEKNHGFKQGQEVLIYFNGVIELVQPKTIDTVGKIEIIKEESGIQIPESVLRNFYSSFDNVEVTVENLNNTGITFTIKDTNKFKYNYADTYVIKKKNVNAMPAEENESYSSIGAVAINWEELGKVTEVESETTGIFQNVDENTVRKTYDWSNLYGELEERRISIFVTRRKYSYFKN